VADAEDLTQGFFCHLLEKGFVSAADPAKGRFRCFVLTALRRFLRDERDRVTAGKRDGGDLKSVEWRDAEMLYSRCAVDHETPERLFERGWALAVLEHAALRLARQYEARGRAPVFEHLKAFVERDGAQQSYREAAAVLGMSEPRLKLEVHRLRARYHRALAEEIAETVLDPETIDEEMEFLRQSLRP
jgi:RNA polymerase sigma-70 factor (ECF subfamily)